MAIRNIDDIIPPSRRESSDEGESTLSPLPKSAPKREKPPRREKKSGKHTVPMILGALFFIALALGALYFTSASEAVIYPKVYQSPADIVITATRDGDSGTVPFKVITFEKLGSQNAEASGSAPVNERASGTIIVSNNNATSQRLIKNTRFEAKNGNIYRIQESVTVPAKNSGGPGKLEVTVYADQPGESYNLNSGEFTLPGLKSSPALYTTVTASTKTPLAGGFVGNRPSVLKETEEATRLAIKETLAKELQDMTLTQIPEGYILLRGATRITFSSLPIQSASGDSNVSIQEKGVLEAVIFNNEALSQKLAVALIASYKGAPIHLEKSDDFALKTLPPDTFGTTESLSFAFSGTARLVYAFNIETIRNSMKGQTRNAVDTSLKNMEGVERAQITLRPFWKATFPEDASKIKVFIKND